MRVRKELGWKRTFRHGCVICCGWEGVVKMEEEEVVVV